MLLAGDLASSVPASALEQALRIMRRYMGSRSKGALGGIRKQPLADDDHAPLHIAAGIERGKERNVLIQERVSGPLAG